MRRIPGAEHKALAGQVAQIDRTQRKSVILRQYGHERIEVKQLGFELLIERSAWRTGKSHIDCSVYEGLRLGGRRHFRKRNENVRIIPPEISNNLRDKSTGAAREKTDVDSSHFSPCGPSRCLYRMF